MRSWWHLNKTTATKPVKKKSEKHTRGSLALIVQASLGFIGACRGKVTRGTYEMNERRGI